MDELPEDVRASMAPALVRSLDVDELRRAFRSVCELLVLEIKAADAVLAERLSATVLDLASV